MKCKNIRPLSGCLIKRNGVKIPIVIHYTYGIGTDGRSKILKYNYTYANGENIELDSTDVITPGNCCCNEVKEHYLCINEEITPVWVSIDTNTLRPLQVVNTLTNEIVDPSIYIDGFKKPCAKCTVKGCINFYGFDSSVEEDYTEQGVTVFEVYENDTLLNTIVVDFLASSDGVNKSSWYTDVINYINDNTNFTLTVKTERSAIEKILYNDNAKNKVQWNVNYSGPGNESLKIIKGNGDTYIFNIDSEGNMDGLLLDPFGREVYPGKIVTQCDE